MQRMPSNGFGRGTRALWPAWRTGMAPWAWTELLGTASLSGVTPTVTTGLLGNGGGGLIERINAWNSFCAVGNSIYIAGMGGHGDYWGNEAYQLNLSANTPAWVILSQPTPTASVTFLTPHYADGRPTSCHLYYSLWAYGTQVIRVGGYAGSDNVFTNPATDVYDLTINDWVAASTYADMPASAFGWAQCMDSRDGTIYAAASSNLYKRNVTTGAWTQLAVFPDNGSATSYGGTALDTKRNQIVIFRDAYQTASGGLRYDIAGNAFTKITFTGASSLTVVAVVGNSAWYDSGLDKFILKSPTADAVYLIDPVTWGVTVLTTAGGSAIATSTNGPYNKFVQAPNFGGYAYQPNDSSNVWFLANQ